MNYINTKSKIKHFTIQQPEVIERIKEYNRKVDCNEIPCLLEACPQCIAPPDQFRRHELRKRQFNVIVEEIALLVMGVLIRWACPGCGKTFTQYPDFALPYKRYVLPDIMKYAERYVEDEKMTYARLAKKWAAGYQRKKDDIRLLAPITIHRWITTLGGLKSVIRKAQALIHQKNPSIGLTRHLAQLSISCRKFKTSARRQLLISCRQLLHIEKIFTQIFHVSIFSKLAAFHTFT